MWGVRRRHTCICGEGTTRGLIPFPGHPGESGFPTNWPGEKSHFGQIADDGPRSQLKIKDQVLLGESLTMYFIGYIDLTLLRAGKKFKMLRQHENIPEKLELRLQRYIIDVDLLNFRRGNVTNYI